MATFRPVVRVLWRAKGWAGIWVAARWADRLIYLKTVSETQASLHSEGSDTSRQSGGEACTGIFLFRQMGRS
jgi:hypothetical protein